MLKKLALLAVLAALVTVAAGCPGRDGDVLRTGTYTFMNRSSYQVTVDPNGQESWSGFRLGLGDVREVTIFERGGIKFIYSPSNLVRFDNDGSNTIFTNR
jgi:hypothetical protein